MPVEILERRLQRDVEMDAENAIGAIDEITRDLARLREHLNRIQWDEQLDTPQIPHAIAGTATGVDLRKMGELVMLCSRINQNRDTLANLQDA